jgi:hypothetical protein
MITSTVLATLMSVFGAGGCATQGPYAPYVIYYAPYPIWYPKYIGPVPYSDYLVVQYVTPPAETAVIVKQRILAVNAANPVLLPAPKEPLPSPRPTDLPPPQK